MKPKLLDLYCGEGGASVGYDRAGFDVYGVDLFPGHKRKRYPFPSFKGDALAVLDPWTHEATNGIPFTVGGMGVEWLALRDFAVIAASPPCQRYSRSNARKHDYPDLIGATRNGLRDTGLAYVMENVVGAPLLDPIMLCGRQFGLTSVDVDGTLLHLNRHRIFESNVDLLTPGSCSPHDPTLQVAGCYEGARRDKLAARHLRVGGYVPPRVQQQELMGIGWMTQEGMFQAVPPVYTQYIGVQLIAALVRSALTRKWAA